MSRVKPESTTLTAATNYQWNVTALVRRIGGEGKKSSADIFGREERKMWKNRFQRRRRRKGRRRRKNQKIERGEGG